MKLFRQFFAFLVYSNLFIAACALLMVDQSVRLLLHQRPDSHYLGFVFAATLCSYSFHYYLTFESVLPSQRISWAARNRYVYVILFILGLGGLVWFTVPLIDHWPYLLPAAVATFLYSAPKIPHPLFRSLRKVAVGKTIFLAFIWMYVTTVLPVLVAGGVSDSKLLVIFAVSRFFFIYAICILFDYRDRLDDRAAGVRSLITYLDEKSIRVLYYCSLLVYAGTTLGLLSFGYTVPVILILLLPGIILAFSYNYSRRHLSDVYYYFFLDGLMALSALLLLAYAAFD